MDILRIVGGFVSDYCPGNEDIILRVLETKESTAEISTIMVVADKVLTEAEREPSYRLVHVDSPF